MKQFKSAWLEIITGAVLILLIIFSISGCVHELDIDYGKALQSTSIDLAD